MKKTLMALTLTAALSTTAMAATDGVAVTLGYTNDNVINEEGLRAEAELRTAYSLGREVRVGLTTLTDTDAKLLTYGAYVGYAVPVFTNVKVVPRLGIEQYRDADELLGFVDAGLEYTITDGLTVDARAKYSEAFDSDVDMDGVSYMFGVTKAW